MIYNFMISTRVHHHDSRCTIITSPVHNIEMSDKMPPMRQPVCWYGYHHEVCFSDGRHPSGQFCFSCQGSWDGWKLAVFPGTVHHVYFLTGSPSTSLYLRQIYLGSFLVVLQISSSFLAPWLLPVCGQHLCWFQGLVTYGVSSIPIHL